MAAQVWRAVGGSVKSSGWAVIEDRGYLRAAAVDSGDNYLFSEVGAGVEPLVITGESQEIRNWFSRKCLSRTWAASHGIKNVIPELPEVYMTIQKYVPGARFVGLFPANDIAKAIFDKVSDKLGDEFRRALASQLVRLPVGKPDKFPGIQVRKPDEILEKFIEVVAAEGYEDVFKKVFKLATSSNESAEAFSRIDFDSVFYKSKASMPDTSGQLYVRFHYLAEGKVDLSGNPIVPAQNPRKASLAPAPSRSWLSSATSWLRGSGGSAQEHPTEVIEVLLGRGFVSYSTIFTVIKAYLPRA